MNMEAIQLNNEAAVVGSFCVDAACFHVVERMLTVDDFAQAQAKAAYQAALRLRESGKPIDPVAIADALGDGGVEYIASCMKAVPSAANVELYCEGVLNASKRRKLGEFADALNNSYFDYLADPDEILCNLRNEIDNVAKGGGGYVIQPNQAKADFLDYYGRVKDNPEYAFCKTGFDALDYQLGGGMFRQGMYVVGARPGMGKTTLALNIAENIASANKPVLFVSLEMSRIQIMSKRLSMSALLPYTSLMTGRLNNEDYNLAVNTLDKLTSRPFELVDRSNMTTADILKAARQIDGISAVVVDYLGLIKPSDEAAKKPRYEQMTEISAALKAMAKMLDVPVLVLCQLNRENVSRGDARPRLTDLRDSGAIEQDADAVILLHRKDYYEATKEDYQAPETEEIELIVAKNRHANTGVVKMAWNGISGRIGEYDTAHIESADELPF